MQLRVERDGNLRCVYDEAIDLTALGALTIRRASSVEPDRDGAWWADLSPLGGPRLGPFAQRSLALAAEESWLERNWLGRRPHFRHRPAPGDGSKAEGVDPAPTACPPRHVHRGDRPAADVL